jgi:hypothetical protein
MMNTQTPSVPEIISGLARAIWKKMEYEGDPPEGPTLSDIQNFTQDVPQRKFIQVVAFDEQFWVTLSEESWNASDPPAQVLNLRERLSDALFHDYARDARNLYNHFSDRTLSERNKQRRDAWRAVMQKLKQELRDIEEEVSQEIHSATIFTLSHNPEDDASITLLLEATANEAQAIANFLLQTEGEPTLERALTLHNQWKQWRKSEENLQHPLAPIVRAWIQQATAKQITREYDRKHPAAIIERSRMGSIRDVTTFSNLAEELDTLIPFSAPAPESQQIEMPGLETQSILPEVLPLQAVHMRDGIETTKRGAVAMPIRLFFEAMMALDPKETQVDIRFKLGDLLRYLNPDGKYNRTNHLPHVLRGLHSLHFLRIPYRSKPDNPSTEVDWIPVLPRTVPNLKSGNDASIILEVKLPPDARSGMMVEKDILRLTGKKSSAKFNAYLTACWIFDRYGTTPKGIIDPTKPAAQRDTEGYLTNGNGKRIFDDRGKPIKDRYHAKNIAAGERTENEARERYPILSFEDLTRACFPKGFDPKQKRLYKKRALKGWEALETDGILRIEKHIQGWRILPSDSHIGRYRALEKNVY